MTTRVAGLDGGDTSYPGAPLRLIIPEVVGSAADLMSRIIGDGFAAITGQPVIYENLFLEAGVTRGATAAPDGYTLLYGSAGNLALLPHVKKIVACDQSGASGKQLAGTGGDDAGATGAFAHVHGGCRYLGPLRR